MTAQENVCPEIAFLENYHEVGGKGRKKNGKGEVGISKIVNRNPHEAKKKTSSAPTVKQTTRHLYIKKKNSHFAQALAEMFESTMNGEDLLYTPSGGWISPGCSLHTAFLCCTAEAPSSPS